MFIILTPAATHAGSSGQLSELEAVGKKWRSYSACQKAFILGYAFYKEGNLRAAEREFRICDGKYSVLQPYISGFLKNITTGGNEFIYIDQAQGAQKEAARLEEKMASSQDLSEDDRSALVYDTARAYFKARRYQEAGEMFTEAAEYGKYRLQALELLATSLARQERYGESIDIHRRIIAEYAKNPGAKTKAMFKIGFLYMDSGDYARAREELLRLKKIAPSYQKTQVDWFLVWSDFKTGDFSSAAKRFNAMSKAGDKKQRQRALYWFARSLEMAGRKADAQGEYQGLTRVSPYSYYGLLAGMRLDGRLKFSESGLKAEDLLEDEDEEENEDIQDAAVYETGLSSEDEEKLAGELARAFELDRLGISELVREELEAAVKAKRKIKKTEDFRKLARKNDAWHLILGLEPYPKAHAKIVGDAATRHRMDPLFVWSIMREESTFRPKVVSRSGAMGLMQLMPFTAERMLKKPLKTSRQIEVLFTPRVNIEAGVKYLTFLKNRYDGDLFLTAAAYNAGEDAVDRWRAKEKLADEEFVEEIPYKETSNYVRKVMRSYWIYRAMYR